MKRAYHKDFKERILARTERLPWSGCWIWMGPLSAWGYGATYDVGHKAIRSHRLSYREFVGPLENKQVLHHCDIPCCVNPDHLYLGTNDDNMRDIWARDRAPRGSERPFAKLTEDKVREIKASPLGYKRLAALYGVGKKTIENIKTGKKWRHVQ